MSKRRSSLHRFFTKNLVAIIGLVLVWRGLWYALDVVDARWFHGSRAVTALGGVVIGILLLYLPDKDHRSTKQP